MKFLSLPLWNWIWLQAISLGQIHRGNITENCDIFLRSWYIFLKIFQKGLFHIKIRRNNWGLYWVKFKLKFENFYFRFLLIDCLFEYGCCVKILQMLLIVPILGEHCSSFWSFFAIESILTLIFLIFIDNQDFLT